MSYRLQLEGLLGEKRLKLKELVIQADAEVRDIHFAASPHIPVQNIDADGILARAQNLKKYIDQIKKVAEEIEKIEADLGKESDG
jgi:hypothetical protein